MAADCLIDEGVKGELRGDVQEVQGGERQLVDEHGPQRVEEDLEGAEEGLPRHGVQHDSLERRGDVRVQAVDAEGLVVRQVVGPEGCAVGDADRQVGEDCQESICCRGAEGEVVRDLVDGEEEVLVGSRADRVGCQEEGEGEEGRAAEEVGACYLECNDEEDEVFC